MAGTPPLRVIGLVSAKTIVISPLLQIGNLAFAISEHPSKLTFGGTQKLATHDLIGGGRVAQTLGDVLKDVTWSGNLWGTQGTFTDQVRSRIRALDQMRASGAEQRLKYLGERYDVVVTEFEGTYYHRYSGEYTITVKPIRDASGRYSKAQIASVDAQTTALTQQAQQQVQALLFGDPTGAAPLTPAVASAAQAVASVSPIAANAGQSTSAGAITTITGAISQAQSYLATAAPLVGSAQVVQASSLVSSLQLILSNVRGGQAPSTISVIGGSLSQLAAQYYGDPTLARALGAANGIIGLVLPPNKRTTLVLPPLQPTKAA